MIRTERRGNILLAIIDMPGRTMNVFSWGLMDAFDALLDRIEHEPEIVAVVMTSGKDTFLAGADLEMVRDFTHGARAIEDAALVERTGRLGRLFVRLEAMSKPFVAAINGLALGGGLELTMACHARLVADDPRIQLGLPEIKLGLLAGAGGTQRLPRLIGIEKGMEFLLNGLSLKPADAHALGLVDEIVPAAELVERAMSLAGDLAGKPIRPRFAARLDRGPFDFDAPDAIRRITRHFGYADRVTSRYPAYDFIVRAVIEGAEMPIREGDHNEILRFVDLIRDPVAGNMVSSLFLNRQKADKLPFQPHVPKAQRYVMAAAGNAAEALAAALQAAKATLVSPAMAVEGDIIIGPPGSTADLVLLTLAGDRKGAGTGIVVRRSREYGTAIEILAGDDEAGALKALALGRQLRATPFIHRTSRSLLLAMEAAAAHIPPDPASDTALLDAQAAAAAVIQREGGIEDPAMADVISVVSGVFPAYAGGPFTYIGQKSAASRTPAKGSR